MFLTNAGDVAVTLDDPATAGAGTTIQFIWNGDENLAAIISCKGKIIAPHEAAADSVTFGEGQRIGASVRFLSDGAKWHAFNTSPGCTWTIGT